MPHRHSCLTVALTVALGVASGLVFAHVGPRARGASPTLVAERVEWPPPPAAVAPRPGYALAALRIVHAALTPVSSLYVDPARIDPWRMFVAALDAVEREVPSVAFRLSAEGLLDIDVGQLHTTLDVTPMVTLAGLEGELRRVAAILATQLGPEDVPDPVDGAPLASIEFAMVNGMLATLDPHSSLLPPERTRALDADNQGQFGGLGVDLVVDDDTLRVERVVPESPADRAGVQDGDRIRRIDGQSTVNVGLDDAIDLLRGPIGQTVMLEIVRDGLAAPVFVPVVRGNVRIHEVEARALPGGFVVARVPAFHASAHDDLVDEVRRLEREEGPIRGFVLDLRGNPGGYLNQAIAVADAFLRGGEIVATQGPHETLPDVHLATDDGTEWAFPMVVLVDAESASASEIVAGALRGQERAVIVGERTFGKGSVQNLEVMPFDSKLKFTVAEYLTPGGRSIQSVGIPADIEVVPTWVGVRPDGGHTSADAAVVARDLVQREADLTAHLDARDALRLVAEPAYRLRVYEPWPSPDAPLTPLDPATDPDLRVALDVLAVAPSAHRADMLEAAAGVVRRQEALGDAALVDAFERIGVDWSGASDGSPADVVVALYAEGGKLVPGQETALVLTVENRGTTPLHRVVGVLGGHEALGGLEFPLGLVPAGGARTWARTVRLPEGWPAESSRVSVELRDDVGHTLATARLPIEVAKPGTPHLVWRYTVVPEVNGQLAVGDLARIEVEVQNLGDAPSYGATARIRNRAGQALDVITGTLRAGRMLDRAGEPCAVASPGWENGGPVGVAAPDDPRFGGRVPPVWADGCRRVLAPGDAWVGAFEVRVLQPPLGASLDLELSVGDEVGFDVGVALVHGLWASGLSTERIALTLGDVPTTVPLRMPPQVRISHEPLVDARTRSVRLAGVVLDDLGVTELRVYADDDKIAYVAPAAPTDELPFDVAVEVPPGTHHVVVVARDTQGFTTTLTRRLWRDEDDLQAGAAAPTTHP